MRRFIQYLLILGYLLIPVSLAWGEVPGYATTQQKETTVYTTRTGEKYHRSGCCYLSHSQITTAEREAVKTV